MILGDAKSGFHLKIAFVGWLASGASLDTLPRVV
jgi:hypothetical protein